MKVIIDTNILISAVLKDRDPELVIQFVVDSPEFEWVVSPDILAEYKAVLSRPKFRLTPTVMEQWFDLLETCPTVVQVDLTIAFPTDPGDAKFLACSLVTNADFLITGDRDLTDLTTGESLMDTAIVTVASFKALFCDSE